MGLRAYGVSQRQVFTGAGLVLVVYRLIPHAILKSAVSYPLQSKSRTGLSLAMFATVISP